MTPREREIIRHCGKCRAPRKVLNCWKCGTRTTIPAPEWEYPALPPVDRIRELAREVGYAIGVHGSLERDLDLIAAPWTDNAIGNHGLMEHIAKGLGAKVIEIERKPVGRYACTIQMDGWFKNIDLSVCPTDAATSQLTTAREIIEVAKGALQDRCACIPMLKREVCIALAKITEMEKEK